MTCPHEVLACWDTLITDTLLGMRDPLREPTFMILAALAPQPLHGYAIIGEVAELSGGRLALRPGTLYGALDRLGDEGLLEPDHEEVVDGRLRRYYRLSDDGAAVLEHEAASLQRNAEAARGRLARRQTRRGGSAGPVLPGVAPRPAGGLA
jgi:DNA-binding PadR family transcriptional regulator